MDEAANGFTLRRVNVAKDTEDNRLFVGLSENHDDTGRLLIFQLGLSFDDQDVALGMDKYCLSNENGASIYGGVIRCALANKLLALQFVPEAAELFDGMDNLLLRLDADDRSIEELRQGLRRVLSAGAGASVAMSL